MQAYEGVVIAKRNRGLNSSFVVRKISSGEGVERTFQTYSPLHRRASRSSARATCAARSSTTCAIARASRRASAKSSRTRTRKSRASKRRERSEPAEGASRRPGRPRLRRVSVRERGSRDRLARRSAPMLRRSRRFASRFGLLLAYAPLASGGDFPEDSCIKAAAFRRRRHDDESHALRSAGYPADRLRRGGPGGAAPADPEILREDARRPGQRRRGAALHQSCQPHTERPRPPRPLRRGTRASPTARPSSASRTSSATRWRRPASRPTSQPPEPRARAGRDRSRRGLDDARRRRSSATSIIPGSPSASRRSAARRS